MEPNIIVPFAKSNSTNDSKHFPIAQSATAESEGIVHLGVLSSQQILSILNYSIQSTKLFFYWNRILLYSLNVLYFLIHIFHKFMVFIGFSNAKQIFVYYRLQFIKVVILRVPEKVK